MLKNIHNTLFRAAKRPERASAVPELAGLAAGMGLGVEAAGLGAPRIEAQKYIKINNM